MRDNQDRVRVSSLVLQLAAALTDKANPASALHISYVLRAEGEKKGVRIASRIHFLVDNREFLGHPRVFLGLGLMVRTGELVLENTDSAPAKWQRISDAHYSGYSDNIDHHLSRIEADMTAALNAHADKVRFNSHLSWGATVRQVQIRSVRPTQYPYDEIETVELTTAPVAV
jgi:hypothetical protein